MCDFMGFEKYKHLCGKSIKITDEIYKIKNII